MARMCITSEPIMEASLQRLASPCRTYWKTIRGDPPLTGHDCQGRVGGILVQEFVVTPEEQWRRHWPRKSCTLWINESVIGLGLGEAKKRQGQPGMANGYDDLRGLVESTPDGWRRPLMLDLLERGIAGYRGQEFRGPT
jgi:hypothetical protein